MARLICLGCKDRQISQQLGITEDSVRLHIKKLFARFEVKGRLALFAKLVLLDRAIAGKRK